MTRHSLKLPKYVLIILVCACLVFVGASGYLGYKYRETMRELKLTQAELASSTANYKAKVSSFRETLLLSRGENTSLNTTLTAEQKKNAYFAEEIKGISNTVGYLDKWSKVDPELLKKYSKVYFLSEHYVPKSIVAIDAAYISSDKENLKIHGDIAPYLNALLIAAKKENISLKIASAYRSFGEQSELKAGYRVIYGVGTANQFSADQGYSEHQLGTTIDFSMDGTAGDFSGFEKTTGYTWLRSHAHEYGFVLSYPPNNAFYVFEPWHWRFVGKTLAKKLHEDGKYFYDLDQRVIDSYRATFFD